MSNNIGSLWLFKEIWGFDAVPIDMDFELFMKALLICANGDGRLTDEERDWVVGYCAVLGGTSALLEELKTYSADEDLSELVAQRQTVVQSERALIYDAIRACAADAQYHGKEQETIRRMAAKLGVSEDVVKQLEEVHAQEREIRQRRLALVWADGRPY